MINEAANFTLCANEMFHKRIEMKNGLNVFKESSGMQYSLSSTEFYKNVCSTPSKLNDINSCSL